jgi:hypothetical protein
LSIRFDAVGARISAWRLLKGCLIPDEWRALVAYYDFLGSGQAPWGALKVLAAPYITTVSDLYLEVADWKPDIVLWDSAYLAVGEAGDGASSRMNERAGAMVRETKLALERLGIPGIISWHFNRDVDEEATNASPNHAILTDEIGRIADVILGLFRPPPVELAGEAVLRTLKVRDGLPLRELKIMFQVKDCIQFAEIGEPPKTRAGVAEEARK